MLDPAATLVLVGAPKGSRAARAAGSHPRVRLASLRASQTVRFFISTARTADLAALGQAGLAAGTVTPVGLERSYALRAHAAEARARATWVRDTPGASSS